MAKSLDDESKPFNQLYHLLKSAPTTESVAKEASDLHKAAVNGDTTLLRQTLSSGEYDIDLQDDWGNTALYMAVEKGHIEVVKSLISHGAKINADGVETLKDSNPMHCVRDVHIAELLLKAGGDVNAKNSLGDTPLHRAVMREDLSIISFLLDNKAGVNLQNNEGCSALHTCCNFSEEETMVTAMKNIISHGGDLNITDHFGMTPLHHLAKWSACLKLAVKTLVSEGSDLSIRDYRGNCPVHYNRSFLKYEEDSFIETLKEFNVSPESANVTDFRGQTPLHLNTDTSVKVVDKLVQWGCQVNSRDNNGKTALIVASGLQNTKDIIEHLLKVGGNVNEQDDHGRTSLHEAARAGNHVTAQLLLSHKADPNAQDICGCTPLHEAALKQDARTIEMLLKNGALVNYKDINMSTALHFAAWADSVKCAEFLLGYGADTELKDNLDHTPLDVAKRRCAGNVFCLLSNKDNKTNMQTNYEDILNTFALSNCGGKFLSFEKFSKMIENNEINRKDQLELQPFLRHILQSPDIGRGCDEDEGREIQLAVEGLVQNLADRIGKTDWRFRCSLLHAGSMSEGTKTQRPDEFDFIFALEEFSKHCYPVLSEDDSRSFSGVYIPAHYTEKGDETTIKIEKFPKAVERKLSVSVSDYANITINNTVEAEPFLKFAGSTIIPVYRMFDGFTQLITKILFSKSFPKNPMLEVKETTIEPAMSLCWRGCRYKDLEINIDLVPAIVLQTWPTQFRKDSILMTPDILRIPSLIVPKMTAGTDRDLWRCSLAPVETAIFRKLKPTIKNSYIACKALISSHIVPQISFEEYEEAMNIYRQQHDSLSSEESIEVYENAEHILPSYMLKMMFLAAIESRANTSGIQIVYMDDCDLPENQSCGHTKSSKETAFYGPSKEMYTAEKCQDLDVQLVLDVFKRCAECLDNRFVPSLFNPKHNILGSRVMENDLDKVAIVVKFIQKLLD